MDRRKNDEEIMIYITRIDERTLNILEQMKLMNGRTRKNEEDIVKLKEIDAEAKGTAKLHGWVAGGVSSIIVAFILTALGIKK